MRKNLNCLLIILKSYVWITYLCVTLCIFANKYPGNPNTQRVLQDKDIVERQKGWLVFVDAVYKIWIAYEYL